MVLGLPWPNALLRSGMRDGCQRWPRYACRLHGLAFVSWLNLLSNWAKACLDLKVTDRRGRPTDRRHRKHWRQTALFAPHPYKIDRIPFSGKIISGSTGV